MGDMTPCVRPRSCQSCKRGTDRSPRVVEEEGGGEAAVEASVGGADGEGEEDIQTGHLEVLEEEGSVEEGGLKDLLTGVGNFHKTKRFDFNIIIHLLRVMLFYVHIVQ
jgi:hypothetical protein